MSVSLGQLFNSSIAELDNVVERDQAFKGLLNPNKIEKRYIKIHLLNKAVKLYWQHQMFNHESTWIINVGGDKFWQLLSDSDDLEGILYQLFSKYLPH